MGILNNAINRASLLVAGRPGYGRAGGGVKPSIMVDTDHNLFFTKAGLGCVRGVAEYAAGN